MIKPRKNGSSTSLAQITNATSSAALTDRNTIRGRVQPPTPRLDGGSLKLAGLVTSPPILDCPHIVEIYGAQAGSLRAVRRTKPNQPERGDHRSSHPGSAGAFSQLLARLGCVA